MHPSDTAGRLGFDPLKVWSEDPLCPVIGMANVIAALSFLAAY
jgi:hypothetical protein